jgi:type I restriction enzyme S subunit
VGYSRHYKFLKEAVIPVPPLAEQKRIAAILDKADSLRRKRQQAIQLADQFLRAVFLDMFGDPVTNPKGWELKELGSLATIRRGASPRPIKNYLNGTIPWIKIGDGSKGNQLYLEKTAECVTEDGAAKSVYLEPGSLIFANCGVSLGFARILKVGGCIHDGWLSIENLHSSVNKIFLLKWINQLTNHFRNIAPDGTQPNLNTGIMKAQKLMLPPIEMQNQFEKIVHSNELFLEKIIGSRKEGNELFYAISQKAFAGEL